MTFKKTPGDCRNEEKYIGDKGIGRYDCISNHLTQPCEGKKKTHPFLLTLVSQTTVFDMKKKVCCCFYYSTWKYQLY